MSKEYTAIHSHNFNQDTGSSEKKVNVVFALTFVTMIVEIVAGTWFGSMALLADGWHMFTHAAAFAIAMYAYWYAKKYNQDSSFSFGTGKVTSLGGFASAVALTVVALMMAIESIERLISPQSIQFIEAISVAVLGLVVNIASAFLLHDDHHHHHGHGDQHHHGHHHDHNLKAAYFHVLADTLTSLFAIIALIAGKYLGWVWMDSLMGIVGAIVITRWAYRLLQESSSVLLDRSDTKDLQANIKQHIESELGDRILDLHIWRVSSNHKALILSVETSQDRKPEFYRQQLSNLVISHHVTVEINRA